jgi:hypothetical protein
MSKALGLVAGGVCGFYAYKFSHPVYRALVITLQLLAFLLVASIVISILFKIIFQ